MIRDERRRAKTGLSLGPVGVGAASTFRFGSVAALDVLLEGTAALGATELGAAGFAGAAFAAGASETTALAGFATAAGAIC